MKRTLSALVVSGALLCTAALPAMAAEPAAGSQNKIYMFSAAQLYSLIYKRAAGIGLNASQFRKKQSLSGDTASQTDEQSAAFRRASAVMNEHPCAACLFNV